MRTSKGIALAVATLALLVAGCASAGAGSAPASATGTSSGGLSGGSSGTAGAASDGGGLAASGSPSNLPPASSVPTQPAAVPLPDACALVTADDLAPLVNLSVKAMPNTDAVIDPASQSACSYVVDDGASGALLLTVTDPGSIDGLVANVPAQPVAGLGDSAYEWEVGSTHTLAVAQGPLVLLAQLSTRFYPADVTLSMMRIALSRVAA